MKYIACVKGDGVLEDHPEGYILGLGRDIPEPRVSHLYKGIFEDPGQPMCRRGYNRDDGTSYSIFRGRMGNAGICVKCLRRAQEGLDGFPPKGEPHIVDRRRRGSLK